MKIPLSWLKDYVDIKLPIKELMWKMTEIGLTCESYTKIGNDFILDIEVTPNRADWLSVVGVARELSALQNTQLKFPRVFDIPSPKANLSFKIYNDFKLCPHYSAITIKGVKLAPSSKDIQDRLTKIVQRPINNLVDVTNYVMFELGNPIHVFDYDKLKNGQMAIMTSNGGEKFTSVDEKSYILPKDSIIFKSGDEIVDLCGIKGGVNSGISQSTKNILILVAIYDRRLIRKTSQKLDLYSDASRIFERRTDADGTLMTLKRTVNLMTKLAGGSIASNVVDDKKQTVKLRKISLSLANLQKVLGIKIEYINIKAILERLDLSPHLKNNNIEFTIPTYRSDLKIEEDLIEEVARFWGYNKFPKTLPSGTVQNKKISYFFDPQFSMNLKELMFAAGFNEVQTLSLTSKDIINKAQLNLDFHIKIANPVSKEYEYLRSSIVPSLLSAIKLNNYSKNIRLFELNKVYSGPLGTHEEAYKLTIIESGVSFREFKGHLDIVLDRLGINDYDVRVTTISSSLWHPTKSGVIEKGDAFIGNFGQVHAKVLENFEVKETVWGFELDLSALINLSARIIYKPIGRFPSQTEDVTFAIQGEVMSKDIIKTILKSDKCIKSVKVKSVYRNSLTLHISYQNQTRTLNDAEVKELREKYLRLLKKNFGVKQKINN